MKRKEKEYQLIEKEFRKYVNISVEDTAGNFVGIESFKGKYIYVDFWATWCQPCRDAIPYLAMLYDKYSQRGLQVISISLDNSANKDKWKKVSKDENIFWENWNISRGFKSEICSKLSIRAIPRYLLIDPNGFIILEDAPFPTDSELDKLLNLILE